MTEFLLARIAEDEEAAGRGRRHNAREVYANDNYGYLLVDPARVIAECEAKRRFVEAFVDAERTVAGYDNDDPNNPPSYWQEWGNRHALAFAVEAHAAVYANHPDYRQEWKP